MKALRNQRGVAMVTVLFVGMVLTVTVSSAAFITVRELQSGTADLRGGKALAYAEAGIDRMMSYIRSSRTGWRQITLSGCPYTSGTATTGTLRRFQGSIGTEGGTFDVYLSPVDTTNTYCAGASDPLDTDTTPPIDEPYRMTINSVGTLGSSTKTIRQAIELTVEDFPLGMAANTVDANGSGTIRNMVLMSQSTIQGRNKLDFEGTDFFYTKDDFYDNGSTAMMPASAHSLDKIYVSGGRQEHPPVLNCTADKDNGDGRTSGWDGSSTGGTITSGTCSDANPPPPTSKFTQADFERVAGTSSLPRMASDDHIFFREVARESGIYCSIAATRSCSRLGTTVTDIPNTATSVTVNTTSVTNAPNACVDNPCYVVSYIEFAAGTDPSRNIVNWNAAIPNNCTRGMVLLIVKNGSVLFGGTARYSGAIFAEDGRVETRGGPEVEGSFAAQEIRMRGNPVFSMSACWLQNLPGPFIRVTALRWSEIDR